MLPEIAAIVQAATAASGESRLRGGSAARTHFSYVRRAESRGSAGRLARNCRNDRRRYVT